MEFWTWSTAEVRKVSLVNPGIRRGIFLKKDVNEDNEYILIQFALYKVCVVWFLYRRVGEVLIPDMVVWRKKNPIDYPKLRQRKQKITYSCAKKQKITYSWAKKNKRFPEVAQKKNKRLPIVEQKKKKNKRVPIVAQKMKDYTYSCAKKLKITYSCTKEFHS